MAFGDVDSKIREFQSSGRTVIGVSRKEELLGIIALGDRIRPDAISTISSLHEAGIRCVLLTGDNKRTAEKVATQVGINQVYSEVRPGEKAEIIRALQRKGKVSMVGDGINDAPSLMQADVGIAMGSGTDIAIESADIIIINSRLKSTEIARNISIRSYRKMLQNVMLAFIFNGVGIPIAATGMIYPIWAMAAMAVSVTSIFFNSLWGKPSLFFDAIMGVGTHGLNKGVHAPGNRT